MMDEFLDFAVDLAREAGDRLCDGFGQVARGEVDYKGWRNLVTRFDREVEEKMVERIRREFPDHAILAEEGGGQAGASEYRWVIDPLDGTTNYVHRHPIYCVSVALEDQDGVLAGVVFAPHLDELFTALRGRGAQFNLERPLRVSEEDQLSRALLASGFAYRQGEEVNSNLENWSRLSMVSRGLRRCGAAALDLAYVADGRYDGFWELYLSPWDVAAGALLVREAGGRVTDGLGGERWPDGSSIVASNGRLHEEIRRHLTVE
jgi:myo-inositol-1(or 4)-monophosphatase